MVCVVYMVWVVCGMDAVCGEGCMCMVYIVWYVCGVYRMCGMWYGCGVWCGWYVWYVCDVWCVWRVVRGEWCVWCIWYVVSVWVWCVLACRVKLQCFLCGFNAHASRCCMGYAPALSPGSRMCSLMCVTVYSIIIIVRYAIGMSISCREMYSGGLLCVHVPRSMCSLMVCVYGIRFIMGYALLSVCLSLMERGVLP